MKARKSKAKADSKLSVKKTAPAKKGKEAKDPNKPKRPPSAFFVFMEEFREEFKKKHPNTKGVAAVGKAGGDKWRSFSDAEKAPYIQKAEKRKAEYEKAVKNYNKKQAEGSKADEEEESDKSKSEVNDEDDDDDDDDGSEEEDDD